MKQQQQILTKKKKYKKIKKLLMIDVNQLSREEMIATSKEIMDRLIIHFRNHIGYDESTTPCDIFISVMEVNPDELSIFKREYWWNVIKKLMSKLKSSGYLFIIHRGQKWFVLKTQEEANQYRNMLNRGINAMVISKIKANEWVSQGKWKHI